MDTKLYMLLHYSLNYWFYATFHEDKLFSEQLKKVRKRIKKLYRVIDAQLRGQSNSDLIDRRLEYDEISNTIFDFLKHYELVMLQMIPNSHKILKEYSFNLMDFRPMEAQSDLEVQIKSKNESLGSSTPYFRSNLIKGNKIHLQASLQLNQKRKDIWDKVQNKYKKGESQKQNLKNTKTIKKRKSMQFTSRRIHGQIQKEIVQIQNRSKKVKKVIKSKIINLKNLRGNKDILESVVSMQKSSIGHSGNNLGLRTKQLKDCDGDIIFDPEILDLKTPKNDVVDNGRFDHKKQSLNNSFRVRDYAVHHKKVEDSIEIGKINIEDEGKDGVGILSQFWEEPKSI